ncbi:Exonuclease I [Bibersteinia trehalosi USDA-ARS-USMARC-189]|uniref:Exonuclease I n=1 Tax=Bibersteinia trehalosi USDA-ARS-USMARC-189 TaxID=1263831 RepID=A0ABM5PCX1_BIBTR|nr:Exonuclease I [Bibersteinia trehalosi USDA-ARS-USMARC-189]
MKRKNESGESIAKITIFSNFAKNPANSTACVRILAIFFGINSMSQATFFIYDFESFGVNPASDRPAQFAGIRTDMDFNIIGEPMMIYCKQTADYLPSPEAMMVTGITPKYAMKKGSLSQNLLRKFTLNLVSQILV